jgi:hypothetical protein
MIKKEEIKSALQRSGYLMECRVADWLSYNSYEVYSNIAFPDPFTEKTREIDLLAELFPGNLEPKINAGFIERLVIETINNPIPIAFFQNKGFGLGDTILTKLKYVTTPKDENDKDHFLQHIEIDKYHHLKNGHFSTQYCSFQEKKGKKNEWMAFHPDDLYQTFLKLYYYPRYITEQFKELLTDDDWLRLFIYQPVLILQGEMYLVDVDGRNYELHKSDYVKFDFSQYYKDVSDSIVIDIITERYLPKYIAMIQKEEKDILSQMAEFCRKQKL